MLARRTRARLQARDASAAAAADGGRARSRGELGWSAEETDRQVAAYVALIDAERAAPGLAPTTDGSTVAP